MRPDYSLKRTLVSCEPLAKALNGCPEARAGLGEGPRALTLGHAGLVRAGADCPYLPWWMVRAVVLRWEGLARVGARPTVEALLATSLYAEDDGVQEFAEKLIRTGGHIVVVVNPDLSDHDQIVLDRIIRLKADGLEGEALGEAERWVTTSIDGKRFRVWVLAGAPQEKYHDA